MHGKIENKKLSDTIFCTYITYEWEWHGKSDEVMAYGLWTPSNTSDFQSVPLILYLHGWAGAVKGEGTLKGENISGVWNRSDWKNKGYENFCAYVLVPSEGTTEGEWRDGSSTGAVQKLLDKIISEYNIDTENIIVCGHSRGNRSFILCECIVKIFFKMHGS